MIAYIAEVGGAFISYHILDDLAAKLPGVWAILGRIALPVLLILAWRRLAGQTWKTRDLGITKSTRSWVEGLWLVCFQSTYFLGILLAIAHFRYYSLLDFLAMARDRLNGYHADYGPFVLAIALFSMVKIAWGGELLCRGLAQGLGTVKLNAAAGAVASWLAFGAAIMSAALQLGYRLAPDSVLWGLLALVPGPVCEAFYFRNHSLLRLVAARTISCSLAFTAAGFFLYWYPVRSFSVAMPLLWTCLVSLIVFTAVNARRLYPLWQTTVAMIRIGLKPGFLPGIILFAIISADGVDGRVAFRVGVCFVAATLVLLLRGGRPKRLADKRGSGSPAIA